MCKQHPDLSPRCPHHQTLDCHVARAMEASPAIPEAGQLVMGALGDRNGQLSQILPDQPESRPLHPEAEKYPGMGPAMDPAQLQLRQGAVPHPPGECPLWTWGYLQSWLLF